MVSYYASAVEPCLSDHYNHDELDLQVFMDRVMDDAASDIHQLIDKNVALLDEVSSLEKGVKLRKYHLDQLFYTISHLIKILFGEMVNGGCEFDGVSDNYTLVIPSEGGVRLAKSIVKCGIKCGMFAKGQYSYARCDDPTSCVAHPATCECVHIKLEELEDA